MHKLLSAFRGTLGFHVEKSCSIMHYPPSNTTQTEEMTDNRT